MLKTNQLVIVAGTSAIGKTTVINKIMEGSFRDLCVKLGIENPSPWLYCAAKTLSEIQRPVVEKMLLHYDINARRSQNGEFEYLSELIVRSETVIVLTLCADHKILVQRMRMRFWKRILRLGPFIIKDITWLWKFYQLYKSIYRVLALYEKWSLFVDECGVSDHLLVDTSMPYLSTAHPFEINEIKKILSGEWRDHGE